MAAAVVSLFMVGWPEGEGGSTSSESCRAGEGGGGREKGFFSHAEVGECHRESYLRIIELEGS